jgi:hypothetical protein
MLHSVLIRIENAAEYMEITLGAFLDIEGTFDKTTYGAIVKGAKWHGFEPNICRGINFMLENRSMVATLSGGLPTGGTLSPLMWSLVMDEILGELNRNGCYAIGYGDDIVILINGKFSLSLRGTTDCPGSDKAVV